ncbi:MAG: RagB/SusD family nutrient uptake outer membrane protein [Chitinophagaceae bacterium]|nr:RagB/SusD family nutrient uptake outer membrane protein [Chitinophagaceae bacterium]
MKKILSITIFTILLGMAGCKKDSEFLDVPPISVIPNDVAFSDPALVLSILGDLYNRQVDFSSLDNGWRSFADFSESFPSENGSYFLVTRTGWGYGEWAEWNYGYIRELNLFIQRDSASTALTDADKTAFMAEARFLRANYYFELVKRMGGVPLITSPLEYDPAKGDVSSIQIPRAKESDVYDFIISEAEAIKNQLPARADQKSRATKGAALAMEARAALYAGSIAKYGVATPQVSLPGGEVGIPAAKSAAYFTIALRAAQEIITGSAGAYKLYQSLPNLSENFATLFIDKSGVNLESIFVEDFRAGGAGRTHGFTINDQPYSFSDEGGDAGRLNPSLNLVQSFEKLDNTFAPIPSKDGAGNPIYYDNQEAIFAGRDARLAGTVLLPNGLFKGSRVDIWAGYLLADGSVFTSDEAGQLKKLPGTSVDVQVVGKDGPVNIEFRAQSGFYIRKYLDPTVGSGRRGRGSDVSFIRYRFGEVLLNAAEAAFELGQTAVAAGYINQVRARAGLTIPLTPAQITFDRIVNERRVELAFEGHTLYDKKRWRIAHIVWDGSPTGLPDLLSNLGSATKKSTQPWGLWPYKVHNPGNPNNGKWVFREVLPPVVSGTNRFQLGNYYSNINDDIISRNTKIIRQPNQ